MTKDWGNPRLPQAPKEIPPVVQELFKLLPAPGSEWPLYNRVCFLKAAAAIFDVTYGKASPVNIVAGSDRHPL